MESKKMNRNLFSIFWCILYFMPVLVLLLSLVGNYIIYKDSANNLKVEYQETHIEPVSYDLYQEDIDYSLTDSNDYGLYLGTYLSDDVVKSKIINCNFSYVDASSVLPGLSFAFVSNYSIFYDNEKVVNNSLLVFNISNYYLLGMCDIAKLNDLFNNLVVFWCSDNLDLSGYTFSKGWYFNSFTTNYIDIGLSISNLEYFNFLLDDSNRDKQSIFAPIVSLKPSAKYVSVNNNGYFQFDLIQENNTYYMSFFDISMFNTDNTFKKFQLPFLRNGFEKVFGLLQFENTFTSSFVITTFVWFIQFMLLHVIVDTLTFIFKLYHKLMEKVV